MIGAKLHSFEEVVLAAVGERLPEADRPRYLAQLRCINKVQRNLEWNQIEFYCMRFFKVRWPDEALFENRAEFVLTKGRL